MEEKIYSDEVPGSLLEKTRKMMKDDKAFVMQVFRDTGIGYFWLRSFAKGAYSNPGVNRVQYLYEYLSGRKLTF